MVGLFGRVVGASVVLASLVACGAGTDAEPSSAANALSPEACEGTADTGFCARNFEQGESQVSECWSKAGAPWEAYLAELKAARDDATHPELARCAKAATAKRATDLRRECAADYSADFCNDLPEGLLRLWAEATLVGLDCYTDSPEYKAKHEQFFAKEGAFVAARTRCVGRAIEVGLLSLGCFLLQSSLSSDKGTASASCLKECPAPGPGGTCVPRRYQQEQNPLPCGIIKEVDGLCDCSEETNDCAILRDIESNPDGLCPRNLLTRPHMVTEGGRQRLVACEAPAWMAKE